MYIIFVIYIFKNIFLPTQHILHAYNTNGIEFVLFACPRYSADLFPGNRVGVVLGIFILPLLLIGLVFNKFFNAIVCRSPAVAFDQRKIMRVDEAAFSDFRRVARLLRASRVWEGRRFASLLFILFCTHTRAIPCLRWPYVFFAFFPPLFISCFFFTTFTFVCVTRTALSLFALLPPENVQSFPYRVTRSVELSLVIYRFLHSLPAPY